jgi:hypothetical protein
MAKQNQSEALSRERALTTLEAAPIIGASAVTLEQWRILGKGPPFFRAGRSLIRYRLGDLLDWRDARTVRRRAS